MQVTVEESGVIERKLNISISSEEMTAKITSKLNNVSRQAKIPGFRSGKAPRSIIERRYSTQVTNEVINDKIQSSYQQALIEQNIVPAGMVEIEISPFEAGQDFQFVVTIDLFPEIPSPTLEGKSLEKPVCEVVDEDVERTLSDLQKRHVEFREKAGQAVAGDRITIDFDGKIDGKIFAGGSAEDFSFVLGEGHMLEQFVLEQFDSALIAASAGDNKTIEFTFPDDYYDVDVVGKDVNYSVTVKKVEQAELPELDYAFAEQFGILGAGMDKMKEEIRSSLERELADRIRSTMRDRTMDALHEANQIELPRVLVEQEIDQAVTSITRLRESQGLPATDIDRNHYAEKAKKRVALGLIAMDVIKKNEIKVDGDAVRARIEEMAEAYDDAEAFVNYYYSDEARLQRIEAAVLEQQVVNTILETADVKEVKVNFRDFMNPQDT